MSKSFYITTAIDYPNGSPHMGHAYEKIITDVYARWYRFREYKTHFLTGTDENGQKLIESAQATGQSTQEFVDEQVVKFRKLCTDLNISHDDFIRTTENRHHIVSQDFWTKLEAQGDVYAGKYSGQYCMHCEAFYTETQAPDKICPDHKTPLILKEEEGYFFKLSRYQEWIVSTLKANPQMVTPKRAYNEVLSRLEGESLRDLAISRPSAGWGVPVPGQPDYVMYTWFDALINYYSALNEEQKSFWPCDVHVIGKDILWFHAVLWPCMLHALKLPIAKQVYVHGMILAADGRKMSKSLNNGVDPNDILARYPLDSFRYYLLRHIPAGADGAFSERDLIEKHNNELGNDYGNLLMRVIKLAQKSLEGEICAPSKEAPFDFAPLAATIHDFMERREHNRAIDALWEAINKVNQLVNDREPWKFKNDPEQFKNVIYDCLYGIHGTTLLLQAFLPDTSSKALGYLGQNSKSIDQLNYGQEKYVLSTPEALFPKLDKLE
jgi:methionyl-tRNA synthetase